VFLREMRERGGVDPVYAMVISEWCRFSHIEDAAQVFDEMPIRTVLKDARVLLLEEASRMQDAVGRMLQRRAGRTHAVREELQYGGCE
jgi:pentatricopeptide repeat protein